MEVAELIKHRRHFHQNPETAFEENNTRTYLVEVLSKMPIVKLWEIAETGLLVQVCGTERNPGLLYRTDMDALPITENNPGLAYASTVPGKAHLCGHDGHMAIALGLVDALSKNPGKRPVYVLFQPAEETGQGALRVLKDPTFSSIPFLGAFALHNLPGQSTGQYFLTEESFSASVSTLVFNFKGKVSHAAEPFNGINPSYAIGDILAYIEERNQFYPNNNFKFGTPVCVKVGDKAYGTNPGDGELHVTIRASKHKKFEKFKEKLIKRVENTAKAYQLSYTVEELELFPAVKQYAALLSKIEVALAQEKMKFSYLDGPNRWGEDFGFFSDKFPTLMFGVGAGKEHPALHNENYDFPDEIIEPTVKVLTQIFKD